MQRLLKRTRRPTRFSFVDSFLWAVRIGAFVFIVVGMLGAISKTVAGDGVSGEAWRELVVTGLADRAGILEPALAVRVVAVRLVARRPAPAQRCTKLQPGRVACAAVPVVGATRVVPERRVREASPASTCGVARSSAAPATTNARARSLICGRAVFMVPSPVS